METPGAETRRRVKEICDRHGLPVEVVTGPSRCQRVIPARKAVARYLRHERRMTLSQVGHYLGDRDHTSVHYMIYGRASERPSMRH
jgi:chromosomal replication initiation ATPase DnaA